MSDDNHSAAAQKVADEAAASAGAKPAAKAKDKTPAWQLPDYAGPLDINQAQWRLHHIKPVDEARRK